MCYACRFVTDPDTDYIDLLTKTAKLALTDEITPDHFDEVVDAVKKYNNLSNAEVDAIFNDMQSDEIIW